MDKGLIFTAALNAAAMLVLCVMVWLNMTMHRRQKAAYSAVLLCTVLIVEAELVTVLLNGAADGSRGLHILANYIGFALTPLLPVLYGVIISELKRVRLLAVLFGVYWVFLALSQPLHLVFYVDGDNWYHRCGGFWVFLLAYVVGILYLLLEAVKFGFHFQNRNKVVALLLTLFLILGTTIQVADPTVRISWTCVTMAQILFYTYLNELWRQVDGLTGLLNHSCFLNEPEVSGKDVTLVILDVDQFKEVNDTYGHQMGDRCLRRIARTIRMTYEKYGRCYRIGGDEFAVILDRGGGGAERLNAAFAKNLARQRQEIPNLPGVSVGYAVCPRGERLADAVSRADKMMYQEKKRKQEDVWFPLF